MKSDKPPNSGHRLTAPTSEVAEPARSAALRLCDGLLDILGDSVVSIWLYGGQLSRLGSPGDVDLHVVVKQEPDPHELASIRELHEAIRGDLGIEELDAWYVLLSEAQSGQPPRDLNWHVEYRDENWALKRAHWFAGAYAPVHGICPEQLVARPSWSEVEAELLAQVGRAASDLDRHPANLTLRLCRVLLSLETCEVVHFKTDAADRVLGKLTSGSQAHVAAAVRVYRGVSRPGDAAVVREGMRGFYDELRSLVDATVRHSDA